MAPTDAAVAVVSRSKGLDNSVADSDVHPKPGPELYASTDGSMPTGVVGQAGADVEDQLDGARCIGGDVDAKLPYLGDIDCTERVLSSASPAVSAPGAPTSSTENGCNDAASTSVEEVTKSVEEKVAVVDQSQEDECSYEPPFLLDSVKGGDDDARVANQIGTLKETGEERLQHQQDLPQACCENDEQDDRSTALKNDEGGSCKRVAKDQKEVTEKFGSFQDFEPNPVANSTAAIEIEEIVDQAFSYGPLLSNDEADADPSPNDGETASWAEVQKADQGIGVVNLSNEPEMSRETEVNIAESAEVEPCCSSPDTSVPKNFELTFSNFVDLQSRLVLEPYHDGICTGAVVTTYQMTESPVESPVVYDGEEVGESAIMEEVDIGEDQPAHPEDIVGCVLVSIPHLNGDNGEEDDDDWTKVDFAFILSAIRDLEPPIVLRFQNLDATEAAKEENCEGVGIFKRTSLDAVAGPHNNNKGGASLSAAVASDAISNRLSAWGSRVRSSTSQLAQEAKERAQLATRLAMEEAERQLEKRGVTEKIGLAPVDSFDTASEDSNDISVASESASENHARHEDQDNPQNLEVDGQAQVDGREQNIDASIPLPSSEMLTWKGVGLPRPPCGLYLQKESGNFVQINMDPDSTRRVSISSARGSSPLHPTTSPNSSYAFLGEKSQKEGKPVQWQENLSKLHPVTNTSILIIRGSLDEPCPAKGYQYQWYRSIKAVSTSSSRSSSGEYADDSEDGSYSDTEVSSLCERVSKDPASRGVGWFPLEDATYAAFQPSATDIGHRIRCVVTVNPTQCASEKGEEVDESPYAVICEVPYSIVADKVLFNAARLSFSGPKGGTFTNLKGKANADGRVFKLQIMPSEGGSRMHIFQTSGSTAEPMHNTQAPIIRASAVSAPAEPKVFELFFPSGLPTSAGMIEALCDEHGSFKLRAPNRVTRESLLLSLGIANHSGIGQPSDLTIETTLYPVTPPGVQINRLSDTISITSQKGVLLNTHHDSHESSLGKAAVQNKIPLLPTPPTPSMTSDIVPDKRFEELEVELRSKIEKLFAKEKTVSDLQRHLAQAETKQKRSDAAITLLRSESKMDRSKIKECQKVLRSSKRKLEMQDSAMRRIKDDYEGRIAALETRLEEDAKIITDNQKTIKVLENEKTVLSAAVDARDGKLSKMNKLQTRVDSLKTEVNNGRSTMRDLDAMNAKFNAIRADLEKTKLSEKMYMEEAKRLATELEVSDGKTRREQNHAEKCKAQLESANKKCQKLKVERNTYKQRADSLAKDMSRVCRNGMGVENIEVIMQDYEKMTHELSLIKTQKRKALDELEESRRMHQHSIEAQMKAGIDGEVVRAVEQRDELERIVLELTEYIDAKEMQLETLQEVNNALLDEITVLTLESGKRDKS